MTTRRTPASYFRPGLTFETFMAEAALCRKYAQQHMLTMGRNDWLALADIADSIAIGFASR